MWCWVGLTRILNSLLERALFPTTLNWDSRLQDFQHWHRRLHFGNRGLGQTFRSLSYRRRIMMLHLVVWRHDTWRPESYLRKRLNSWELLLLHSRQCNSGRSIRAVSFSPVPWSHRWHWNVFTVLTSTSMQAGTLLATGAEDGNMSVFGRSLRSIAECFSFLLFKPGMWISCFLLCALLRAIKSENRISVHFEGCFDVETAHLIFRYCRWYLQACHAGTCPGGHRPGSRGFCGGLLTGSNVGGLTCHL